MYLILVVERDWAGRYLDRGCVSCINDVLGDMGQTHLALEDLLVLQ